MYRQQMALQIAGCREDIPTNNADVGADVRWVRRVRLQLMFGQIRPRRE